MGDCDFSGNAAVSAGAGAMHFEDVGAGVSNRATFLLQLCRYPQWLPVES